MQDIHSERILILDFGAQYTQLIARRVREAGVYCEIRPFDIDAEALAGFGARGIILSGGPESVHASGAYRVPGAVFAARVPVLGICYGMQAMAAEMEGTVEPAPYGEFGFAEVRVRGHSRLLRDIQDRTNEAGHGLLDVWMSHGDRVTALPPGFKVIASSEHAPIAGMADESRGLYAVQFHPEVTHTRQGQRIIERFVHEICGLGALWVPARILEDSVESLRERVGHRRVLLALSGGVDSSVVAALLHRAVGAQLSCIFVDHGLLRLNEGDEVMAALAEHLGVEVRRVDAAERFLSALGGVSGPEEKRKVIGRLFIEVFEHEAQSIADVTYLAQGTIYPDVIESAGSGGGKAHVIKSHHNVGGLPETMQLELLEPLRELFKDEVRKLGIALGLPHVLVYRHPFPGPGLGVRILGEVKPEYAQTLREADAIFIDELRAANWYDRVSQAFAVYLPVSSVGVVGDQRRYEHVIALRAVETLDFMTARWAHLPYELLERVSNRIINEVLGVSRVVYDISGKPPATIEWE